MSAEDLLSYPILSRPIFFFQVKDNNLQLKKSDTADLTNLILKEHLINTDILTTDDEKLIPSFKGDALVVDLMAVLRKILSANLATPLRPQRLGHFARLCYALSLHMRQIALKSS